ncbi:acetyl-CoA synthetase-like protein [Agrocybe pediades]|nr:acetyl-CoA synthetase-like protein [Agrocybe pediades]
MSNDWSPKRSLAEVNAFLTGPGQMHETETRLIDGLLLRVYKNLWPSLRVFWLWAANEHKDAVYAVFENQRHTFADVSQRSLKAAAMFRDVYGVHKGDRVVICSRNFPEVLVAFWACHLLGAVSALANAWSPLDTLRYCIARTECKLIIVDPERADRLEHISHKLMEEAKSNGILVLEAHEGKGSWAGMESWASALESFKGDPRSILTMELNIAPEDNATILFTSGTTGMPKGVLSTQRQFITNVLNVVYGGRRAALRRGDDIPLPPVGPQKGILLSVPLFHVTGLTSLSMLATMSGLKVVMMRKWNAEEGARLIKNENVAVAGGVPSMVSDLADSSGAGQPLDSLMFGGAPAHNSLAVRAQQAFPTASLSQGYGLTETSSVAVGFSGEDYLARPTSCGLPTPINDIVIVNNGVCVPPGTVGEVWIRGPNVMKGYWRDQEATDKVLTKDGWFKSGDLGCLDEEGFLYIRDRIKDIIIRGGENIDSVSVENAIYVDERVLEVAAVGVPDKRLGELVAAVVSVKPAHHGKVTEASLIELARKSLPKFAVPVMILVQNEPFERTPSGKIIKTDLRKVAEAAWMKRAEQPASKL